MNRSSKKSAGALVGAAFIMATSAIGPGFLTQTANFTGELQATFGFVILVAVCLAVIVQLNVWRVLCVSELRGQQVANKVFPGLGYLVSLLIVLGGLVFNIGNVGGGALGFNALLGIPVKYGYFMTGILAICVFLLKDAMKAMDKLTKILGACMIIVIFAVIIIVRPPMGTALLGFVRPVGKTKDIFFAILTLVGGTVGGYITFAGAHRLIDAGITKEENIKEITKSSLMGMGIASIVRVFLFLAVLGVVATGVSLAAPDPKPQNFNPAAEAFRYAFERVGAGALGYRFFGLVLLCAAITSVIGAAYTSVSFLKTFSSVIATYEKWFIIGFIAISTCIMGIVGSPAFLLVIAGSLNGLILPITLGICLIASQKKSIMGPNYRHPTLLLILGILVVIFTAFLGIKGLAGLQKLF